MAEIFKYYCKNCNISIIESAGKNGRFHYFTLKCMKCNTCGNIGDIVVSECDPLDRDNWHTVEPKCKCGSTDVKPWSFTCPKCGRFVSKESTGLTVD